MLSHFLKIISLGAFLARFATILHTISFPLFILVWMAGIERFLSSSPAYRRRVAIQAVLLGLFSVVSFATMARGQLYKFDDTGLLVDGYGVTLALVLSLLYIMTGLSAVFRVRRKLERQTRLLFFLTPLFLMLSLLFFHLFRQPHLFAISNTFLLLMTYMFMQRRRMFIDVLTRLPNQAAFIEHVEQIVRVKERSTILEIDIENFRLVNDRYGIPTGDRLLVEFAAFLMTLKADARVFRVGGNRFSLVLPLLTHNDVVRIVKSIGDRTLQGWHTGEVTISFHVNIAIVEVASHAFAREKILEVLEFTLQEIKSRRRQAVIIYNARMEKLQKRRLDVLTALRNAIADDSRILMFLQPIFEASSGRIKGAEALMRIEDPQIGLIFPGEFIPAAEHTGLITHLSAIILRKACAFLEEHEQLASILSYISINISTDDLASLDTARRLVQIIESSKIDPRRIGFEVTESMILNSNKAVETTWRMFTELGVLLMLDDFGTGYSNLETLMKLPFSVVKIDRSVVSNSRNNFELITLISVMLERLGKQMVAEGVETREQLEFVQAAGVELVQGYYFSKPLAEQDFIDLLRYEHVR